MADSDFGKHTKDVMRLIDDIQSIDNDMENFLQHMNSLRQELEEERSRLDQFLNEELRPLMQKIEGNPNLSREQKSRELARLFSEEEQVVEKMIEKVRKDLVEEIQELSRMGKEMNQLEKDARIAENSLEELKSSL